MIAIENPASGLSYAVPPLPVLSSRDAGQDWGQGLDKRAKLPHTYYQSIVGDRSPMWTRPMKYTLEFRAGGRTAWGPDMTVEADSFGAALDIGEKYVEDRQDEEGGARALVLITATVEAPCSPTP